MPGLAVICPRWLDMLEARLSEPNDFVSIEIAEDGNDVGLT